MSNKQDFTRRALLTGAGTAVASAALAAASLPVVAKTDADLEADGERLDDLMHRISEILNTAVMGTFCAIIEPSQHEQAIVALRPISHVREALSVKNFLDHANHQSLVDFHLTGLAKAMREEFGGSWTGRVTADNRITVSHDQHAPAGVWIMYDIEA